MKFRVNVQEYKSDCGQKNIDVKDVFEVDVPEHLDPNDKLQYIRLEILKHIKYEIEPNL